MKIIEDEVIGELRYLTVEFDQAELLAGHIGVISQGAVRRYFEGKSPDLKVKKCGGLKLDSQRDIVTMRFGVVNKSTTAVIIDEFAGKDNDYSAAQKLLNPEYDELKAERDMLVEMNERHVIKLDELLKSRNHLVDELDETNKQLLTVQERCDALVAAVMQDAQKFSDLLVENEKLRTALQSAQTYYENDEYGNMGRIFEQTLKEDSADLGREGELEQTRIALFAECPHCVENEELKLELRKYERRLLAFQDVDVSPLLPAQVAEIQKKIEVEDVADLADAKEITQEEAKKIMEENEKYPGQYQV